MSMLSAQTERLRNLTYLMDKEECPSIARVMRMRPDARERMDPETRAYHERRIAKMQEKVERLKGMAE